MNKDMDLIPVILCGGAGTRLWPLSRKHFPKQFVPMPVNGGTDNLFRATVSRANLLEPKSAVVVCNEAHRFFVSDNLRGFDGVDFSILVEPASRNTAPAIALAAFEIREHRGDGLMLVLPSDHTVADADVFGQAVRTAAEAAASGLLVTFGIVPEHAETGYGYIRKGEPVAAGGEVFRAAEFREKPNLETAQRWLDAGDYYWNSGMFLFKASAYLDQLQACAPEIYAACGDAYAGRTRDLGFICAERASFAVCPDISVDYAVMEKAANVALMPVQIGWNDVGSWNAMAPLLECDGDGNASVGDAVFADSSGNVVYAGERRLIAVLGIKDCIIAATPDAVLVTKRAKSQDVKRLVEHLHEQQRPQASEHRKVYRPWGSYESVDVADGFQVKRIIVNPRQSLSLQLHHHRSEHWVVVRGEVRVTRDEDWFMLGVNQSTYIPAETKHRLENPGDEPAYLIEVQCGTYLGEDDIVRFEDSYGRTDTPARNPVPAARTATAEAPRQNARLQKVKDNDDRTDKPREEPGFRRPNRRG